MYIFCSINLLFLIIFFIAFHTVIDEILKIRATLEVIAIILRKEQQCSEKHTH